MNKKISAPINQHYVPRMYLKNWGHGDKEDRMSPYVFVFRKLVNNKDVQILEPLSTKIIACWEHGYSPMQDGKEIYDYENWFSKNIEDRAENAIECIVSGRCKSRSSLAPTTFNQLLKFTVAQLVRTPAYYMRNYPKMCRGIQDIINSPYSDIIALEGLRRCIKTGSNTVNLSVGDFPIKVSRPSHHAVLTQPIAEVKMPVGRITWLSHIMRMVTVNLSFFERLKWHIIEAADNVEWPTSDNPVIILCKDGILADENKGFFEPGNEILFPFSPKHLFYSRVGDDSSVQDFQKNEKFSVRVWEAIFKNAFLEVYSKSSQEDKFKHFYRDINKDEYNRIQKMIKYMWHDTQSELEAKY